MKATFWFLHDAYFGWAGFNQITGLTDEAYLYAAILLALLGGCRIYPKPSKTFTAKTFATLMACALLSTVAYQLLTPVAGAQTLAAPQAWAVILYMTPMAVNRFNASATLNILSSDMKRPPDRRRHAKGKHTQPRSQLRDEP